jgi:hypothetical protein
MPVQRLYIYRCGTTTACALTGEKDEPRLPTLLAPHRWHFWMQTSRDQTEDGQYGFGQETAVSQITAKGYYVFTGSTKLLEAVHNSEPANDNPPAAEATQSPAVNE